MSEIVLEVFRGIERKCEDRRGEEAESESRLEYLCVLERLLFFLQLLSDGGQSVCVRREGRRGGVSAKV